MENKILPQGLEIPNRQNQVYLTKAVSLAVVSFIFFGITWRLLAVGLGGREDLFFWFWPLLAAAIAVVSLGFLGVVNRSKILLWLTNGAILLAYIWLLPKNWFVLAGGLVFFFVSLLFENRIKHDETARADFSMSRIMRDSISLMVYALLIVVGFNVYVKAKDGFDRNPKDFYNQIGHYAARGLEYVPNGLGNFDPDQRFDDFVVAQAQRQDPEFQEAPEGVKKQAASEVKKQLMERFHIQVAGNPLLGEVVAGAVAEKVQNSAESYQKFFPAIFALIAVALLRTVAFLFVWLSMFVSWALFKLLLLFKFFRIDKVQVEVDKLGI